MLSNNSHYLLSKIGACSAIVAGCFILLAMTMITVNVLLRWFGGHLPGIYEIVTNYAMVAIAFAPLIEVENRGNMISVEAGYARLGDTSKKVADRARYIVCLVIYAALCYSTLIDALHKYHIGAYALADDFAIPTWPAYFIMPVAFAFAAFAMVVFALTGAPVSPDEQEAI